MKRITIFFVPIIIIIIILSCKDVKSNDAASKVDIPKAEVIYKDGIYEGGLPSDYEGYKTNAKIVLSSGKIKFIEFQIIDTNRNVPFDGEYVKYMDNNYYRNQCREDWSGLKEYIKYINQGTDFNKMDSVSGATWSFRKLKSTIEYLKSKAIEK